MTRTWLAAVAAALIAFGVVVGAGAYLLELPVAGGLLLTGMVIGLGSGGLLLGAARRAGTFDRQPRPIQPRHPGPPEPDPDETDADEDS